MCEVYCKSYYQLYVLHNACASGRPRGEYIQRALNGWYTPQLELLALCMRWSPEFGWLQGGGFVYSMNTHLHRNKCIPRQVASLQVCVLKLLWSYEYSYPDWQSSLTYSVWHTYMHIIEFLVHLVMDKSADRSNKEKEWKEKQRKTNIHSKNQTWSKNRCTKQQDHWQHMRINRETRYLSVLVLSVLTLPVSGPKFDAPDRPLPFHYFHLCQQTNYCLMYIVVVGHDIAAVKASKYLYV